MLYKLPLTLCCVCPLCSYEGILYVSTKYNISLYQVLPQERDRGGILTNVLTSCCRFLEVELLEVHGDIRAKRLLEDYLIA
jgi:hypothetical protein